MKVTANINYLDLLKMNLSLFFSKETWRVFLVIYILLLAILLIGGTSTGHPLWIVLITNFVVSFSIFTLAYLFQIIIILIYSKLSKGMLGKHTFEITDTAFIEETDYNQHVTQWSGIYKMKHSKSALYIFISPFIVHVVPARSFGSNHDYKQFIEQVILKTKKH